MTEKEEIVSELKIGSCQDDGGLMGTRRDARSPERIKHLEMEFSAQKKKNRSKGLQMLFGGVSLWHT